MNIEISKLNDSLKEKSLFKSFFDKLSTMSYETKKNITLTLACSSLVAILTPIACNVYMQSKITENVYNNGLTKLEQFELIHKNFVNEMKNNGLFQLSNIISTKLTNIVFENNLSNAENLLQELRTNMGTNSVEMLKDKIDKALIMKENYLKLNKIEIGSPQANEVEIMFQHQFEPLLKEYQILINANKEILNLKNKTNDFSLNITDNDDDISFNTQPHSFK